jgi:hypothetical protein
MSVSTTQFDLDLKSPLATGIPLRVTPQIDLAEVERREVRFVLSHDVERLPLGTPKPWFGIFDGKGALVLRTNYVAGVPTWPLINPAAGRIAYLVDGANAAFAVLGSRNPVLLEWRLIGVFDSTVNRELTAAKGPLVYTPSADTADAGGTGPDNLGDCCDQLGLEIQYELDNQYYYTEFDWDPVTANLNVKRHWDSAGKNNHLFTVAYQWGPTGLLTRKTITRHRDNAVLRLDYTWAPQDGSPTSETLLSIQRSATVGV